MTVYSASLVNLTVLLPQHVTADEYWHLHRSDCQNALIYGLTTSRNFPACDISLGSLTLPVPEAGELVELLLLCF
jgi:hypothetical protein